MKAVILAGGLGTRLMEKTQDVPKPMLEVGGIPLLQHIIEIYHSRGIDDVIVAGGYKFESIVDYYTNKGYAGTHENGYVQFYYSKYKTIIADTGLMPLTGSRIGRLRKFIDPLEPFFMTYGDGLSDVDLDKVLALHMRSQAIATLTAVRPAGRFGRVVSNNDGRVTKFGEKIESETDWINGGFMVLDPGIFDYINPLDDDINFEKDVLPRLLFENRLYAHHHHGFWKCVDTLRDLVELEELYQKEGKVWLK